MESSEPGDILMLTACESAAQYLATIILEPVDKEVEIGLREDADFLQWERQQLAFCPFPIAVPCKIRKIFNEKTRFATKAILFGNVMDEVMHDVVRDMLFVKLMMQQWVFVGFPQQMKDEVLRVQQLVCLRTIVKELWANTPGFLGKEENK